MRVEPVVVENVLVACQRLEAIKDTTDTMVVVTGKLYEAIEKAGRIESDDFLGMKPGAASAHPIKTIRLYDSYRLHFVQIVLDEPTAWVACIGINSKRFHAKMENNLYVFDII